MVLLKPRMVTDVVREFTPGEDKLVILDVNGSPTTLAGLFDRLTKYSFELRRHGDTNDDYYLSSSELDAGARAYIEIRFFKQTVQTMEYRHLIQQDTCLKFTLTV